MGSVFKPKVASAPPPVQATPVGYKSEITGVEQIPVKNADGSWTVVERQTMTPEQKAVKDNNDRIQKEQLARIEALTNNFDVDQIDGLKDTLAAFTGTQQIALDAGVKARTDNEEKALANFGQENSTAAVQERQLRGQDVQKAQQQLGRDTEMLKQDVRTNEIQLSNNLLATTMGQDAAQSAIISNALARGGTMANSLQTAQQNYNNTLTSFNLGQAQQKTAASQAGLSNLSSAVGSAAMLAMMFSDRRLKRDVRRVATLRNGLGVYGYRYAGRSERWLGVMADEVERIRPAAVALHASGYKMVNYGELA